MVHATISSQPLPLSPHSPSACFLFPFRHSSTACLRSEPTPCRPTLPRPLLLLASFDSFIPAARQTPYAIRHIRDLLCPNTVTRGAQVSTSPTEARRVLWRPLPASMGPEARRVCCTRPQRLAVSEPVFRLTLIVIDTSHVPCKFFRQGACQAGNACPFSHDLGAASETICKYFAKVRHIVPSPLCPPAPPTNHCLCDLGKLQVWSQMRKHSRPPRRPTHQLRKEWRYDRCNAHPCRPIKPRPHTVLAESVYHQRPHHVAIQ